MIGTAAFGDVPLDELVAAAELVVAIDVAGGIVRTAGWLASSGLTTAQALERCAGAGVGHLLCTAIDRDGTRSGPDLQLLREVRSFNGTVLAAGGIRDDADVEAVRALGIDGVVVGRAWLEGDLTLSS
jgi:phosphoribosylformimino-5-aminoimidazole carboxamide ribotide isomerase